MEDAITSVTTRKEAIVVSATAQDFFSLPTTELAKVLPWLLLQSPFLPGICFYSTAQVVVWRKL